jgi:hypothetical protein
MENSFRGLNGRKSIGGTAYTIYVRVIKDWSAYLSWDIYIYIYI